MYKDSLHAHLLVNLCGLGRGKAQCDLSWAELAVVEEEPGKESPRRFHESDLEMIPVL